MSPRRKKTVSRKDSLFSTTCERSGNVMKICVNLMPALALSKDPLDHEEESPDYSHRFVLKEEKRTPTATNEDRNPEKDKPSDRPGDIRRTVLTSNGATTVHLNPVFVLPPIAKSNSTLWRRPIHYDHAKTMVSAAPPNPGGAALSSHGGVSSQRGVSSLSVVSDQGSVSSKGWVSDQGGVSCQGRVSSQGLVYDQSGVSSQSEVYNQSRVSSQSGVSDQGVVYDQTGVTSQSGVSDHGVSDQSGVYNQSGVSDQSGVYNQSGVSSESGVYIQCGVSNQGRVIEQNERVKSCEYTASAPTDGPPETSIWKDRILQSESGSPEFNLPEVSLTSLRVLLHRVSDRVGRKSTLRRGDVGVHWAGSGSGVVPESGGLSIDRAVLQCLRGGRTEEERLGSAGKGRVLLSGGDWSQRSLRPRVLPPICPGNRPPVLLTMSTGNPLLPPAPQPPRRHPTVPTQEETPGLKQYIF